VTGAGWDLPVFPRRQPAKGEFDEAVNDRPAYMESADGHSGWANSKALAVAGVNQKYSGPGRRAHRARSRNRGTHRHASTNLPENS